MELFCEMRKITEDTEFEFHYSKTADLEIGHLMFEGVKYTERVMKGRCPVTKKKYSDLQLVHIGKPFKDL